VVGLLDGAVVPVQRRAGVRQGVHLNPDVREDERKREEPVERETAHRPT
jgi:hypothetical protein